MRPARMKCMSCGAVLDEVRDFCDDECRSFSVEHGYGWYGVPHRDRGFPESTRVRKDYRWTS